jgi:Synergist-CTERM protein sorting domain-containing protein
VPKWQAGARGELPFAKKAAPRRAPARLGAAVTAFYGWRSWPPDCKIAAIMRRALLTAVLLAPSLALAQVTITETGDQPDEVINIAECQGATGATSRLAFQWAFTNVTFTDVEVKVSDTSGCPDTTENSTARTSSLGTFTGTTTTTNAFAAPDLLSRIGVPSASCDAGANITVNVCVIPRNATGGVISGTITGTFLFDRARPPTPTAPTVTPGDGALRVSWTAVAGSGLTYRVEATPQGVAGAVPVRSEEVTGTSVRLGSLEIGTPYDVVVIAISEGGNESAASPQVTGIPVQVDDFWRLYRNAGGAEEGGCSTAGASTLALLAFVPFALRRRRS